MTRTWLKVAAIGTASAIAATSAFAQGKPQTDHSGMDHSKMGHAASAAGSDTASTKAFKSANDRMHTDMAITFSGDADVDFVKGMLPHHQGAVEMAKIVLSHGKDPKVRKLARNIIKSQNTEIGFMKAWLAAKGK